VESVACAMGNVGGGDENPRLARSVFSDGHGCLCLFMEYA
jgi:hypothetical protein